MIRVLDAFLGKLLQAAVAAEKVFRKGVLEPPTAASQVLILEYVLPLGACVHLTPVFEALHSRPHTTVIVATRGLAASLLRHSPFIDHLIETPDVLTDFRSTYLSLSRQLKARGLRPDCVLTGAADRRSKIGLLGLLVSSGWRGGYTVNDALYQHALPYVHDESLIANNLALVRLLGANPQELEPRIFYTESDAEYVRSLLADVRDAHTPVLVAVTQNSGGQRTGWLNERWADVLQHVQRAYGYVVVYVGIPADEKPIAILAGAAGGVSFAGKTNIPQLAALLASVDVIVSLDTGTMHVGRCVGVPMVVLGPSWQRPHEWLPIQTPHVRILRGKDRTDIPNDYHLDEISADAVIGAFEELVSIYPPTKAAREERLARSLSQIDLLAGKD